MGDGGDIDVFIQYGKLLSFSVLSLKEQRSYVGSVLVDMMLHWALLASYLFFSPPR